MLQYTARINGSDVFTLFLDVDFRNGNYFYSTFPNDYFNYHFKFLIKNVQCAYVPYNHLGHRLLEKCSQLIRTDENISQFYFPDFLKLNGTVYPGIPEAVIRAKEVLMTIPRTHYCRFSSTIEFFILQQLFRERKNTILTTAAEITVAEFEGFLLSVQQKMDFYKLIQPHCRALEIIEENDLKFVMLVAPNDDLLMAIAF